MALNTDVFVKIKAGVEGTQAIKDLNSTLKSTKSDAESLTGKFSTLKSAFVALGAAAVAKNLFDSFKSVIDGADNLNKLAQKTGIAVDELSKLEYAGKLANVSLDTLSTSVGKFSKLMGDAARGSEKAEATLKQLGISTREVKDGTITITEAMARAGEKISSLEDGWRKNDLAMSAFGKSGREMIPLLNSDIRGMAAELEKMGGVISAQTGQAAEDFNDNLTRLSYINRALIIQLGNDLIPLLNAAAMAFVNAKKESNSLKDSVDRIRKDNGILDWAEKAATGVAIVIDGVKLLIALLNQLWENAKPASY